MRGSIANKLPPRINERLISMDTFVPREVLSNSSLMEMGVNDPIFDLLGNTMDIARIDNSLMVSTLRDYNLGNLTSFNLADPMGLIEYADQIYPNFMGVHLFLADTSISAAESLLLGAAAAAKRPDSYKLAETDDPKVGGKDIRKMDGTSDSTPKLTITFDGIERAIDIVKHLLSGDRFKSDNPDLAFSIEEIQDVLGLEFPHDYLFTPVDLLRTLKDQWLDIDMIDYIFGALFEDFDRKFREIHNYARLRKLEGKELNQFVSEGKSYLMWIKAGLIKACFELYRTVYLIPDELPINLHISTLRPRNSYGIQVGKLIDVHIHIDAEVMAEDGIDVIDIIKHELIHVQQDMREIQAGLHNHRLRGEQFSASPLPEFMQIANELLPALPPDHPVVIKASDIDEQKIDAKKTARAAEIIIKLYETHEGFRSLIDRKCDQERQVWDLTGQEFISSLHEDPSNVSFVVSGFGLLTRDDVNFVLSGEALRVFQEADLLEYKGRLVEDEAYSLTRESEDKARSNKILVYEIDGELVIPEMPLDRDERARFFQKLQESLAKSR